MNEHLVNALLKFFSKEGSDEAKDVYRALGGDVEEFGKKPKKPDKKNDK